MKTKRSEETKKIILSAAGELFSQKGYDAVSIREIAKEAGCSHTTIYLYFKDKEALLHELSMPSLEELLQKMKRITLSESQTAEEKLKGISNEFLHFCLRNKNLYTIFINVKSTRVDNQQPELEINKARLEIFVLMKQTLGQCLSISNSDQILAFSRIFFYNLYGILSTYSYQHESIEALMERLTPTFDLAVEILILGFKEKINQGVGKE
ncbi:TetR/AcrR family transcriptional regulator [Oceanobacillus rekensis]|uniref:TetR/AcrR family transcriptional regulator n=1 Tax=Oceanobacillus rekensis TaxID=937927 RepID=UPI000B43DDD7|nr:TetR/AcrR family transcriptional regulator [Oceanobacillus rekensis]